MVNVVHLLTKPIILSIIPGLTECLSPIDPYYDIDDEDYVYEYAYDPSDVQQIYTYDDDGYYEEEDEPHHHHHSSHKPHSSSYQHIDFHHTSTLKPVHHPGPTYHTSTTPSYHHHTTPTPTYHTTTTKPIYHTTTRPIHHHHTTTKPIYHHSTPKPFYHSTTEPPYHHHSTTKRPKFHSTTFEPDYVPVPPRRPKYLTDHGLDHYEEFGLKKRKKPYHHPYHTTASPVVVTTTVGHGTIDFKHSTTPRPPWDHKVVHSTTSRPWDPDPLLNGAYGVPEEDVGPDEYPDYSYKHHHSTTRKPKFHSTTFTTARPQFHHTTPFYHESKFLHRTPIPDFESFATDLRIPEDSYGPPEDSYGPPEDSYGPPEDSYGPPENGPLFRDEAETMKPQGIAIQSNMKN